MNEISTGLAANASDRANVNREISHSTDPILNRKLLHQGNNFDSYINPELVKYLQSQGVVESYRGGDRNIIIKVPAEQGDGTVNIFISKDNYHINNGNVNQIDRSMLGRLPNIIKRVQADLSGDKSRFNPASTQQPVQESTKPSQGLSKDKKSEVVKKAKAGEDIGKKGKGFDKVANKAAKEYGSKEAGEKVAAAAMWKNIKKEGVEEEGKVVTESELKLRKYIRQHLEENAGLRKPTLNEDKKSETMKKLDAIIDKQFNLYESVVRNRK